MQNHASRNITDPRPPKTHRGSNHQRHYNDGKAQTGRGRRRKTLVEKDKAGQTTSQDRRDEPIVTKEQKDKSNDDEEREGKGQSKRKRKGKSAEFSF